MCVAEDNEKVFRKMVYLTAFAIGRPEIIVVSDEQIERLVDCAKL